GLFLDSTTPIQLAVTTATVEDLPGVGVETIYHPGCGAQTQDRHCRPLIDNDECRRICQISARATLWGALKSIHDGAPGQVRRDAPGVDRRARGNVDNSASTRRGAGPRRASP